MNTGEIGWTPTLDGKAAKVGAGVWDYTDPFEDAIGNGGSAKNYGYYTFGEYQFTKSVSAFIRYGYAAAEAVRFKSNLSAGATLSGLAFGRSDDVIGLAVSQVDPGQPYRDALSSEDVSLGDHERTFEATYKLKFENGLSLQPDFQYVQSPSADVSLSDAFSAILRVSFDWES